MVDKFVNPRDVNFTKCPPSCIYFSSDVAVGIYTTGWSFPPQCPAKNSNKESGMDPPPIIINLPL
jgi:hypothetical protein